MRSHRALRGLASLAGLGLVVLACASGISRSALADSDSSNCPPTGVAQLLGTGDCEAQQAFVRKVSERISDSPDRYDWADFAAWGRELFHQGSVADPPAPPLDPTTGRSQQLSHYRDYTCLRCHNDQREDPRLADPTPEARFTYIEKLRGRDPEKYANLKIVQGTTLWGAVNRISFYNGLYAPYHDLPVPTAASYPLCKQGMTQDCKPTATHPLDARIFSEALQVCSKFCSVGRYMEDWELASMLTFLWDNQVLLEDTDLTPEQKEWVGRVLTDPESHENLVPRARLCLESGYLRVPGETRRDDPGATSGRPTPPPPDACDLDAPLPPGARLERTAAAPRAERSPVLGEIDRDAPALIRHFHEPVDPQAIRAFAATLRERAARVIHSSRGELAPGLRDTPEIRRGERLYELTCANCHGADPKTNRPLIGGRGHRFLAGSAYLYYNALQQGIVRGGPIPYMPEFTLERLSDQQAADLLQYLLALEPEGSVDVLDWPEPKPSP